MNRILFEGDEIGAAATVLELPQTDPRAKHMATVLGVDEGDVVDVGIIGGPKGTGTVHLAASGEMALEFEWEGPGSADSPFPVIVLLGHPRPIVLKRILKDLTTVGVEHIVVSGTDTGEKSYLESRLWHGTGVRRHLIDGASQAGVTYIPRVSKVSSIGAALDFLETTTAATDEDWNLQLVAFDNQPFHTHFSSAEVDGRRVVIAVGSERGFSDGERMDLRNRGFSLYTLGPRVLRTETAAIVGSSLFLAKAGYI